MQYWKGTQNDVADALPRLPVKEHNSSSQEEEIVWLVTSVVDKATVQVATAADPTLTKVIRQLSKRWLPFRCVCSVCGAEK